MIAVKFAKQQITEAAGLVCVCHRVITCGKEVSGQLRVVMP